MTDYQINLTPAQLYAVAIFVGCLIAALWMIGAHFLPWRGLIGAPLTRYPIAAYVVGVIGIAVGFLAFEVITRRDEPLQYTFALLMISCAGGAATLISYAIDHYIRERNELHAHRMNRAADDQHNHNNGEGQS